MNYRQFLSNYQAPIKQLIALLLPILAAHQIGAFIPLLNTGLAGRYDPLWLAATGLGNTVFTAIMGFGWGIITSVGILTANELGKTRNTAKTGMILKASLITSLVISVPIMLLLKQMQSILLFAGQAPAICESTQEYLNGLLWLVFVDFARFSIFQFAIAHHRVTAPLVATAVSIPLILILNNLLIPYFGLYGIGLGTAIAYWLIFIVLWAYLYRDKVFSTCLAASNSFENYCKLSLNQFELGIPMGAMATIELLFFVVIGLWAGQLSTDHLIAHQIASQWLFFTIMAAVSFSEAITILMAQSFDRNADDKLKFLQVGVYLSAISMTLVACFYWLTPELLIRLDLGSHKASANLIAVSTVTLAVCGVFQIFDGIRIALSGGLRGLSDTKYPMWVTLFTFWGIGLPIAYVSTFYFHWEQIGLWFGMTAAVVAMIGLQYRRMHQLLKS